MSKQLFNRYLWLVDTLDRAGRLSFEDIDERWQHSLSLNPEGEPLPRRTFHHHRQAIEEMFDIVIDCERVAPFRYYIDDTSGLHDNGARKWLLDSFTINNALNERKELADRILLEDIPSARAFLTPLLDAMQHGLQVKVTYRSFNKGYDSTFRLDPYCLKMVRQRWYLLGHNPYYDTIRVYALDRMHGITLTDTRFEMPRNFDAAEFFADTFGITYSPDDKPMKTVVRAYGQKVDYLRSLPLHHSQREIASTDEYADFALRVTHNYDFIRELLSHGKELKVLEPASLAGRLRDEARLICDNYSE